MRMKKISLVLTILFLVFSVEINPSAYAMELSSSKTMDKYEEIGKEFLKEYYYSFDMKQDMNVSKYIKDENVLQYVDLKHDIIKNRNVRFFFLHYYDRDKAASTQAAANQNEVIIPEIDLQKIDDFFIGSEPPHLIYADRDKVIFETTGGVYVYDMKGKSLLRSFDTVSFASESYSNVLRSAFATQDGKQLIFIFSKGPGYVAAYRYSLEDKFMSELTGKEYAEYLKKDLNTAISIPVMNCTKNPQAS